MYTFMYESGEIMKILDKFLKLLKTDRNTFFTYIFTVISIYLVVDRLIEILLMIFTGTSYSYWGPFTYTLAIACPVLAFLFSGSSAFVKNDNIKLSFFYLYTISLYIIGISMVVQWFNLICWLFFISSPGYLDIITNLSELVRPAFQSLAAYLPIVTFYPFFSWLYTSINDTKDLRDSIFDYGGIDLSNKKQGGPYSFEMPLFPDKESGKMIKITENRRFESAFICGVSGSGKTSMMFEPMIARDIEKKYFFKEVSKELGFTALKTGLATLDKPYSSDYLNDNFSLDFLSPISGKEKLYKIFVNKMIYSDSNRTIYRDLGLTYISPDYESTSHIIDVAKNFNIPVNIIDPENRDSLGLNPFIYDDPSKTAIAISSVLKGMHQSSSLDSEEMYKENVATQAVENLSILLKEMYPRLNNRMLPNLEDMLKMLNNFDLVEKMCKILEADEELANKYELQLSFFKRNFYSDGSGRQDTEKAVQSAITQLDNLLRIEGVRRILCNRSNNINYDKILQNGEITLVCTRRGDLGATATKAFGLFFLLVMQYSVLRRPGNEKTRIPHFLYIDEFPDFVCKATESIFTLYRKYRVGTVISAQNLSQLGDEKSKFRQTILANCSSKFIFGNNTPEDNDWWSKELGDKREWSWGNDYKTDKGEYDPNYKGISFKWKPNYTAGKVQSLKFKACMYKVKDEKGKNVVGTAKADFLEAKYKEPHQSKKFNFDKFTNGIIGDENDDSKIKKKIFNPEKISFEEASEVDPIAINTTDSKFLFDNDDAIIFDINRDKKNKK